MAGSANLNVMMKVARKAGRQLVKDFGEVEQLQVSTKGPGDFVSRADRQAEATIREELMADTIKTEHDNTAWRLELEAGLASAKIYTIPYHEVAKTGSHYRAWFFGMDVQFLAGLSTSLNVGMDSIYRTGPSIDQNTGPTIRLATTCDAVLGLHKGAMWLYRHSLGILVGKIAAARNKNSTVSITV